MFDSVCWQFPLLQAQEALKVAEGNVALAEAHLGIHDIDTQIWLWNTLFKSIQHTVTYSTTSICGWHNLIQLDWRLVMNFKTIPATREVIESPIEARVSVDQHYIICYHVLSYIIYTIRTLLHMFPVHKMKGLQHLRYPVLQAPLYLPFLVVNKHDIASTLSLCFRKMYPVQSQKWWRSLQKNRVVGGWQFVTRRFGFIVEAVSAVDITRRQKTSTCKSWNDYRSWFALTDWLHAKLCNSKPKNLKGSLCSKVFNMFVMCLLFFVRNPRVMALALRRSSWSAAGSSRSGGWCGDDDQSYTGAPWEFVNAERIKAGEWLNTAESLCTHIETYIKRYLMAYLFNMKYIRTLKLY